MGKKTGGTTVAVPALPPRSVIDVHLPTGICIYGYTPADMHAFRAAGVREAIERAAKLCDDAAAQLLARKRTNDVDRHTASVLESKAAAIRATIPRTDQEQA